MVEAARNGDHIRTIIVPAISLADMQERLIRRQSPRADASAERRTTVMLQRIAYDLDEDAVRRLLDERGFQGQYDAVYVPRNPRKQASGTSRGTRELVCVSE